MHLTNPKVNMTIEGSESTESQQYESELPRVIYFDVGSNIVLKTRYLNCSRPCSWPQI